MKQYRELLMYLCAAMLIGSIAVATLLGAEGWLDKRSKERRILLHELALSAASFGYDRATDGVSKDEMLAQVRACWTEDQ